MADIYCNLTMAPHNDRITQLLPTSSHNGTREDNDEAGTQSQDSAFLTHQSNNKRTYLNNHKSGTGVAHKTNYADEATSFLLSANDSDDTDKRVYSSIGAIGERQHIPNDDNYIPLEEVTKKKEPTDETPASTSSIKWTTKDKIAILLVLFTAFTGSCRMALLAPFFPQEAARKDVSMSVVGVIFSVYELVVFVASPVAGRYVSVVTPKRLYIAGLLVSGLAAVSFGFLYLINERSLFVCLAILIRSTEALGFASYATACITVMTHFLPNNYASAYAIVCCINSLGLMTGPPLGAFLYEIGGFGLPFMLLGILSLVTCVPLLFLLPEIKAAPVIERSENAPGGSALRLARSGLVWAGLLGLVMSAVGNVYLAPTLAPHLETFALTPLGIGACFAIHPILYTICTPVLGFLSDKKDIQWPLLLSSSVGFCVAYVLLGPSPVLPFLPRSVGVIIVGLVFLGISESTLTVPTAKLILNGASELGFDTGVTTVGLMAGINLGGYHFGALVGPLLGGTLTDSMGFESGATVLAGLFLTTFAIFCAILGFRHYQHRKVTSVKEEQRSLVKSESAVPLKEFGIP